VKTFLRWWLRTLFTCATLSITAVDREKLPIAENAIVHFSAVDIATQESWPLDGQWNFYWHEFISPTGAAPATKPILLKVRGTWRGAMYEGNPLPAAGWGSYRLLRIMGKQRGDIAVRIPKIGTAYRFFANGQLVATMGEPGSERSTTKARVQPQTVRLPAPDAAGNIVLIFHVANFNDRHGGIWQTMRIGTTMQLQNKQQNAYAFATFLCGAILLIGLHHFLMYLRNRHDRSHLAFSLLCFLLALRAVFEGEQFVMAWLPQLPWIWNSRVSYLTFYLSIPTGAWLLRLTFPRQFTRWVLIAALAFAAPLALLILIADPRVYTETLLTTQLVVLGLIVYAFTVIARALVARERGVKTLTVGIVMLFGSATIDILTNANILNFPDLSSFGIIGFIFAQSLLLSIRQEDAFTRLKQLAAENRDLIGSMEVKILERTATIAELNAAGDAVLNSLAEGVFLVNRDQTIGQKFSTKIVEILELDSEAIAGQTFSTIIHRVTDEALSEDARLFLSVLFNDALDDSLVMQLNPLQRIAINGLKTGTEKIVSFNFSRQRKARHIVAISVSCSDITLAEMQRLEVESREARAQRQFEIVRTLFSVHPEALQDFYGSIETEIAAIDLALKSDATIAVRERVERLFRAAHTIKGTAQLFKIDFIAAEAHRFENFLHGLLQIHSIEKSDLADVQIAYAELQNALGGFEEMISRIMLFQKDTSSTHAGAIELMRNSLYRMVTEYAENTDKEIEIHFDNFTPEVIPSRFLPGLRDALVQSVRNSLAHGIESFSERTAQGKRATGTIQIRAQTTDSAFVVTIRDDGKSFDIDAIRRQIREHHLAAEATINSLIDDQLIDYIFTPGFSTAEHSDSIAGRGAGMDVIKYKIQQLGGEIRIAWRKKQFTEFTFVFPKK